MRAPHILALLFAACTPTGTKLDDSGGGGPCDDADSDGICDGDDACPGDDDNQDHDADGIPDGCEDDWLAVFETSVNFMDTSSTVLGVQLAYDTHLAISQWIIFEPPVEIGHSAMMTEAHTRDLSGWDAVQERLTDGVDENFCTYVTGLEDDFHQALTLREDYYDLTGLEGAVINRLELEGRDWETEDDPQTAKFRWTFYGYVP